MKEPNYYESEISRELLALRSKGSDSEFIGMYAAFARSLYDAAYVDRMIEEEELESFQQWLARISGEADGLRNSADLRDVLQRTVDALMQGELTVPASNVIVRYCRRKIRQLERG